MLRKSLLLGVSSAAIALAVLCPYPARALTFTWTFTDQNTGSPVSGTIDTPGSADGLYYIGVTATVTQVPSPFVPNLLGYGTFTSGFGTGITVVNGAIDQSGNDEIVLYNSIGSANIQFVGLGSTSSKAAFYDYNTNSGTQAASPTTLASFTAVPAPLPLLGLGAATAFSRQLKQRIALRRKREEVGETT